MLAWEGRWDGEGWKEGLRKYLTHDYSLETDTQNVGVACLPVIWDLRLCWGSCERMHLSHFLVMMSSWVWPLSPAPCPALGFQSHGLTRWVGWTISVIAQSPFVKVLRTLESKNGRAEGFPEGRSNHRPPHPMF